MERFLFCIILFLSSISSILQSNSIDIQRVRIASAEQRLDALEVK